MVHFVLYVTNTKTSFYLWWKASPKTADCFHLHFICSVFVFFLVKEQVQADVIITSATQDERLLKILHGQGTCNVFRFIPFQLFHF